MHYRFLFNVLFVCFTVKSMSQGYPGAREVTYKNNNITLENLFRILYEQTGMTAFYNDEQLDSYEHVSVHFEGEPLDNVLAVLLRKRGMVWCYRKDVFVVSLKRNDDVDLGYLPGEDKRLITGIVVNEKGAPLEAVAVMTADRINGISTGKDGRFSLRDVETDAKLLVRRTGYKPMVLTSYADSIYIQLVPIVAPLQQVNVEGVVQGSLTGSEHHLKSAEIMESPVNNILGAIQGRIPGLYINQTTGLPGGGYRIRLRGKNSIESNSDPLILVDGMPLPPVSFNENFFTIGTTTGANVAPSPLNLLSINDIASIQILKDADATAIYGTKGVNGVILIDSKQPDEQNAGITVTANYYNGIGRATKLVRYLDTNQYLQMRMEAIQNDNRFPDSTRDYDLVAWAPTRYTDWQKEMIGNTARISDCGLELKGGSTNFTYRASALYRQESTVYPSDNFRYTKNGAMVQLRFRSRDHNLVANLSGALISDHNRLPIKDMTIFSGLTPPNAPASYTPEGNLNAIEGYFSNPYFFMLQVTNAKSHNFRSSLNISWGLMKGLNFNANIGGSSITIDEAQRSPARSFPLAAGSNNGIAQFFNNRYKNGAIDLRGNWTKTVEKVKLSLLVGARFQFEQQVKNAHFAWGYPVDDDLLKDTTAAGYVLKIEDIQTHFQYQSFYGRFEYKYADRYILTLSFNRDGSSRLGHQYASFGAVGAAWVFSRESWFKATKLVSFGKLRASYGLTGNDLFQWNTDRGTYVPGPLFSPRGPGSDYRSSTGWEKVQKREVALDAGLMEDKISVTFSYYNNRSTNLLLPGRFQTFSGNSPGEVYVPVNVGAIVQNKGFEVDLEGVIFQSGPATWRTSLNLSFPKTRLVYFPSLEQSSYSYFYSEGMSLDMIKGYHSKGVDPSTGIYQFEDIGNNGLSRAEDGKYGKERGPFFYGGWYNQFRCNHFEISCLVRYTKQNNDSYQYFPGAIPGEVGNQPKTVLNRWQNPGDVAHLQKYTTAINTAAGAAFLRTLESDQRLVAANYLRLQSVVLAYHLPIKKLTRVNIKSCKLYTQGLNLLTLSKYEGRDPEVTAGPDSYPSLRIITIGAQISF